MSARRTGEVPEVVSVRPERHGTAPEVVSVRPEPSAAVLAALVVAVEQAWPRPRREETRDRPPAWRFSGRWWLKPAALRRERPVRVR